ncbi:MAG: hypothetical protein RJB62_437, partial [Pseudomonadota bacterium]
AIKPNAPVDTGTMGSRVKPGYDEK